MGKRLRQGDQIIVITGKHKGTKAKVLKVTASDYIFLEGIERLKHVKRKDNSGEIVNIPAPIHKSNVMHLDPHANAASRISYSREDNGKLQRVYKKSSKKF